MCFKVDVIENVGENWLIADFGVDEDGKHYILTTDCVRASESDEVMGGAKHDAELVCKLLKEHYRKVFDEKYNSKLPFDSYRPEDAPGGRALNPLLAKFYAKIPKLQCKGYCSEFCKVAPVQPIEAEDIIEHHGQIPLPTEDHFNCSFLTAEKRCGIYENRPLICRLWGNVRAMKCKWGCKPVGGYLSEGKSRRIQMQVGRIPTKAPVDPLKILEVHLDKMIKKKEEEPHANSD